MKKSHKQRKKTASLFQPDEIAQLIHQALERDFREAQHVYCLNDSTTLYGFNRQVAEFRKKYCPSSTDAEALENQTFAKFREVNDHMERTNQRLNDLFAGYTWPTPLKTSMPESEKIHYRARALMRNILDDFDEEELFLEARNSSGTTLGVSFQDTSQERKFTFPMSVTKRAKLLFKRYASFDNELKEAIEKFNGETPIGDWFDVVEGSRATTVDKTADKRRMICIEPTCNMFLQQGFMSMLYKRMRKVGLDVETLPQLHRMLAKESSITGLNATIDWSSASDCVALELLRWLLPTKWFDLMYRLRCDQTMINGEAIPLHMVSSMGNAGTFPLESLVFWCYGQAVLLSKEARKGYPTHNPNSYMFKELDQYDKVSVFGDDCIVPTEIASEFMDALVGVGFIVNKEKSYYGSELFRESCGGDFLAGYDVRPFFLKAPHSTKRSALEPWLYIITNSLLKKYISYFGKLSYVYNKALWKEIFSLFAKYQIEIKLVPSFFPDDAGLKLSHDIQRFASHYPAKLSRIKQSKHGTVSFSYCRFLYKEPKETSDDIRYSIWLKRPVQTRIPQVVIGDRNVFDHKTKTRKIGGYVVAKGISCHWHVPAYKSAA